ncbi:type VI secretion system baseplate subunit TssF [Hyalangium sp.]|uniref:type VI secretion system baseplate subunit TssF n=1 Tax=Hyalangium sp. TaxID=2028555 RepID=UPI002D6224E2|nr:type VI secretion system baseplate subunit TssF [Hyalangium sp.]HYI00518.1 type VI secretion system baseplate subunit TssF [Hyalangium sp.]
MSVSSELIYQDFLKELDALERFRQRFLSAHPTVPLDREDPHVRRLIESMAFFSVQTRLATQHNLRSTWLRLFSAFFDFLLRPLPAVALVQALPAEKMTETVVLPRGTELRLAPAHGVAGSFRTRRHLRILPISTEGSEVVRLVDGRFRLILRFESSFPRRDPVGLFSLLVRHLDEYRPSLAVYHALRKQLTQVSVVYDAQADESSQGLPCEFSFGDAPEELDDSSNYEHPLQRVRAFFQQPEQGLFLHVAVPSHRKEWTRFSLCLDLDKSWSVGRSPHPDFLQPFVVPVENLKAEPAQPIVADGTRSEYTIRGMTAGRELQLHSVTGVYVLGQSGRLPMRPAFLPGEGPSYELDEGMDEDLRPRHSLLVRLPEAFIEPQKLLVEALWYQPQFVSEAVGRVSVSTPGRHVEGLGWQLVGRLEAHRDSALRNDVAGLTRLLAWKVKSTLERNELAALLSYLGTPAEEPFRRVIPWLRELKATVAPDGALRGSGLLHVYELLLEPFDASAEPLVLCFLEQVQQLLEAWNAEASVVLRPSIAGAGPFPLKVSS